MRWRLGLAVLIMIGVGVAAWATLRGDTRTDYRQAGYEACQSRVRDRLRSPATAQFPPMPEVVVTDYPDGTVHVAGYVDAANPLGTLVRMRYTCEVRQMVVGTWELVSLDAHPPE